MEARTAKMSNPSNPSNEEVTVDLKKKPWRQPYLDHFQKMNLIGEELYPLICQAWKKDKSTLPISVTTGKITGMLIELPMEEVEKLLEDPAALTAKYEEARDIIIKHTPPSVPRVHRGNK